MKEIEDKQQLITKLPVSKWKHEQYQTWMDQNCAIPDAGKTEVIDLWTHKFIFAPEYEVDIKLVNSSGGAYVDAVLFQDGCEVQVLEPQYVLTGLYEFEHEDNVFKVEVAEVPDEDEET